MNKTSNLLLNLLTDLDGQSLPLGPRTPLDVAALQAAIAAVVLTAILFLTGAAAAL
jgi:hypothetical protein